VEPEVERVDVLVSTPFLLDLMLREGRKVSSTVDLPNYRSEACGSRGSAAGERWEDVERGPVG
jgi:hypothetical protein